MRKVMTHVWGKFTSAYIGHSMTIYADTEVAFGGKKVGGVRISHMTGMQKPVSMVLTETKGRNKPFTVQPLVVSAAAVEEAPAIDIAALKERAQVCAENGVAEYRAFWASISKDDRTALRDDHEKLKKTAALVDAVDTAIAGAAE
jgi:uncharacterized protein YlxW (UPF0749 family)